MQILGLRNLSSYLNIFLFVETIKSYQKERRVKQKVLEVPISREVSCPESLPYHIGLSQIKASIDKSSSVTQSCSAVCDPMDCSIPDFPVLYSLSEFAQTHVHCINDAIQPSHPVTPFSCPQSFPASGSFPMRQLFTSGDQSIGASDSASSNEYSGLFSFKIDWFDLLAFQRILKSFPAPQFKSIHSIDKRVLNL